MKRMSLIIFAALVCLVIFSITASARESYKNFKLAIYCPVHDLEKMTDLDWLEKNYELLDKHLYIN